MDYKLDEHGPSKPDNFFLSPHSFIVLYLARTTRDETTTQRGLCINS
jgi:hypothetical protein